MSASTIPAAVDALLRTIRAATNVQVFDGQPTRDIEADVIVVGWSPSRPAVDGDHEAEVVGERETYEIACLASSFTGSADAKPVRDRAFELYTIVHDAIRANKRLDGTVIWARTTVLGMDQAQTDKGATATVEFVVRVNAFVP